MCFMFTLSIAGRCQDNRVGPVSYIRAVYVALRVRVSELRIAHVHCWVGGDLYLRPPLAQGWVTLGESPDCLLHGFYRELLRTGNGATRGFM